MVAITFLPLAAISLERGLDRAAGNGQGGCRRMPDGRDRGTTSVRAGWVDKACMGSSRSGLMGQSSYRTTVFMYSIINTMENISSTQWANGLLNALSDCISAGTQLSLHNWRK